MAKQREGVGTPSSHPAIKQKSIARLRPTRWWRGGAPATRWLRNGNPLDTRVYEAVPRSSLNAFIHTDGAMRHGVQHGLCGAALPQV